MDLFKDKAISHSSKTQSGLRIVFLISGFVAASLIASESLNALPADERNFLPAGSIFPAKPWAERTDTLVIGRVSHNPQKHYKRLKPIVDYVASKLEDEGIVRGDVLLAKDDQQMIRFLRAGKVDWVTETPFSALLFEEEADAEIVLRRQKKGVRSYHSLFFVRNDSGINSLEELRGKKIAFNDAGSTTSFYLPAAILKRRGIGLVHLASRNEGVSENQLGYIFTGGDDLNVSTWVYKGFVDAGAFSNLDWESPTDTPAIMKKKFKVIYQTQRIPRALELFRKELPQNIKDRVKEILLHAHKDPDAVNVLKAYRKTRMFSAVDRELQEELAEVKKLYQLVRQELKNSN